jgi:hypothetical protein
MSPFLPPNHNLHYYSTHITGVSSVLPILKCTAENRHARPFCLLLSPVSSNRPPAPACPLCPWAPPFDEKSSSGQTSPDQQQGNNAKTRADSPDLTTTPTTTTLPSIPPRKSSPKSTKFQPEVRCTIAHRCIPITTCPTRDGERKTPGLRGWGRGPVATVASWLVVTHTRPVHSLCVCTNLA